MNDEYLNSARTSELWAKTKIQISDETMRSISNKANAFFDSYGPDEEVSFSRVYGGGVVDPISEIALAQEGEGTPSLENVRNIPGWGSIELTYNGEITTQALPETVYGGTYDWSKGELTITHKMINRIVGTNEIVEDFEGSGKSVIGWRISGEDAEKIIRPIPVGGNRDEMCTSNVCTSVRFLNRDLGYTFFLRENLVDDVGIFESTYDGFKMQFVFALLQPSVIRLPPHQFIALSGQNTLSSDCGRTSAYVQTDDVTMEEVNAAINAAVTGAIEGVY